MTDQDHNLPLSERFRIAAKLWVQAEEAASLMEESKSAVFSEMVGKILEENISIAVNKAENIVKSSPEYKEYITQMVKLRSQANLSKVKLEYIRMKHSEQSSAEATARAERRL